MSRFGSLCIIALLACGPLTIVQSLGWTLMLIDNVQTGQADPIARTFDGSAPCDFCDVVQEARAEQLAEDAPVREERRQLETLALVPALQLTAPQASGLVAMNWSERVAALVSFEVKPALPPPRC